jgi:hypothetical protein
MNKGKNNFQARLDNQKEQLERNGYSAEVVVRTTPEATDMINFARLWEHIIVTADRRTRGYMSKAKREDYEKTRQAFIDSVDFMMQKMQEEIDRHDMDLGGNNFVSRIAQRYKLADRSAKADKPAKPKAEKPKAEAKAEPKAEKEAKPKPAAAEAAAPADAVEGL